MRKPFLENLFVGSKIEGKRRKEEIKTTIHQIIIYILPNRLDSNLGPALQTMFTPVLSSTQFSAVLKCIVRKAFIQSQIMLKLRFKK